MPSSTPAMPAEGRGSIREANLYSSESEFRDVEALSTHWAMQVISEIGGSSAIARRGSAISGTRFSALIKQERIGGTGKRGPSLEEWNAAGEESPRRPHFA